MDRYILVEGRFTSLDKFKKDVNDKIAEGYTPLGSPVTEVDTPWIMQAMTRPPRGYFSNPNPLGGV